MTMKEYAEQFIAKSRLPKPGDKGCVQVVVYDNEWTKNFIRELLATQKAKCGISAKG